MEHALKKRRNTSPPASNARNTDKRPKFQDRSRASERRASFMSPTKASLAKFNPYLLQKVATEPRRQSRAPNGKQIDVNLFSPSKRKGNKLIPADLSPRRDEDLNSTVYGKDTSEVLAHSRQRVAGHKAAPSEHDDSAHDQGQDGLGAKDSSVEEAYSEVAHMKNNPLTPTRRVAPPDEVVPDDDEPSLPSTPSQLGLEAPAERPKGLLFGTPSRRSRKKIASTSNSNGPSPLKNHEGASNRITEPTPSLVLGPRIWFPYELQPPLSAKQIELQQRQRDQAVVEKDMLEIATQVLKDVILSRWLKPGARSRKALARKRKKISLLVETFLQSTECLESLGTSVEAGVTPSATAQSLGSTEVPHTASNLADDLAQRLSLFLPFSGPNANPASRVPLTSTTNTDFRGEARSDYSTSPCTVQIGQSRVLPVTAERIVPQKHEVTFYSTSEPAVQLAKVLLTVDSKSLTILSAKPLAIHPWPKDELSNFIRTGLAGKNPTVLGTAIGRYWQVVQLRTHCWKSVRRRFSAHLDISSNADAGAAAAAVPADPDDGTTRITVRRVDTPAAAAVAVTLSIEWTIGFDEATGEVQSRVSALPSFPPSWRGGEGDERDVVEEEEGGGDVLDRVGEAFDAMVRTRGVTEAVEVMVALLFPF